MTEWQETAKQYLDMYQSCKTECDQLRQALEEAKQRVHDVSKSWEIKWYRETTDLRQALEAVEWVQFTSSYGNYSTMMEICLWCGRHKEYGHTPDCQRQLALGGE